MTNSKKKLLLIDGNAFCYRAFYGIRSLSTSAGEPTNAIYGFIAILNKLIAQHNPEYLAVAFDLKGPTFRHEQFSDYKAHRKPMPDELSVQIPTIKKVLKAQRIAIFEEAGYEADDVIATLASILANAKLEVFLATADKDMLQLVDDNIKILNPHKENLILTKSWIKQRFGVSSDKIIEIMSLAGDTSDNIPGVPGIGEATAVELIKRFGTLDEVLANIDKVKHKSRASKIKEFAEQAKLSRELATLKKDIPGLRRKKASKLLEELKVVEPNKEELFNLFKKLEFKTLMLKMAPENKTNSKIQIVCGADKTKELTGKASQKKTLAVFILGSHPEPMRAKVLGIALSVEEGKSFFFSADDFPNKAIRQILQDPSIKKTGHNLKYLKVILASYNINLQGISFDTMLAAYLLNPENARYSLPDLALEHLSVKLENVSTDVGDIELPKICCANANALLSLNKVLHKELKKKGLLKLFEDIEMPLVGILADMEQEGIVIDKDFLLHLAHDFEKKINSLTADIYEMAGESFNINSPKQLSLILFEKLNLPVLKRTKTGLSTDTEVLKKLTSLHPLASELLEFREISKLKSTYVDGLIKLLHSSTVKLHTSFNQTVTATGRLSSSRPNLQNIPIKTKLGRKIRQAFIAENKTELLLSADYSQIELRMLAHLSKDAALICAFKEGRDIHTYTASLIFGVDEGKVTEDMRNTAKTVNFGIIYGMSAFGLSKDLGIEQKKAQEFIQAYFNRYPGVKKFIEHQIEQANTLGFVTTLMKRRRYIPQIKSSNDSMRQFAQRVAMNAPVQGSASDLIKAAMIQIQQNLKTQKLSTRMLLQVHDELVFAVPQKELKQAKALIEDKMENVIKLRVPVKVSIKVGKNWLEME